jgi:hypothetical protein
VRGFETTRERDRMGETMKRRRIKREREKILMGFK